MFRLLVTLSLLALSLASAVKRSTLDECYKCSDFDSMGRGFIEADDNPPMCGHYKECFKTIGSDIITSSDRWCAPGTWTDPEDIRRGAPCTNTACDPALCQDCALPSAPPIAADTFVYPCPYVQMSPAWLYGMWRGADLIEAGTCGPQGYFNDSQGVCTCTTMEVDCTCKVSIPLFADIESQGCNGGWVGQLGMPAVASVQNGCGLFAGYEPTLGNGAHLGTFVIDGAFAGAWVYQLKLTADFNLDAAWDSTAVGTKWGLVTYGDCAGGASFGFHVERNETDTYLVATLELMTADGLQKYTLAMGGIVSSFDYYTAFVFQSDLTPSFSLYVMSRATFLSCAQNLNNCPAPVATADPKGTISPRGCGLIIGHTASSTAEEFFAGSICSVSVDIGSSADNISPCS